MTLPSTPPLEMSEITSQAGRSPPIALSTLAPLYGLSVPCSMSQFLGRSIFSASVSPTSSVKSASTASGPATLSSTFTVTASGQGSISYSWSRVDGYAGFSASGTSAAALTLQSFALFNVNASYTGHWKCHVQDSAGNSADLTVSIDHEYANGN